MSRHRTSKRADDDLLDIYLYGIDQFGRGQSARYLDDLDRVFDLLAQNPRMGRTAESIAPGVRRHEHGAHVILYEETGDGVMILAIVGAGNQNRLKL